MIIPVETDSMAEVGHNKFYLNNISLYSLTRFVSKT